MVPNDQKTQAQLGSRSLLRQMSAAARAEAAYLREISRTTSLRSARTPGRHKLPRA